MMPSRRAEAVLVQERLDPELIAARRRAPAPPGVARGSICGGAPAGADRGLGQQAATQLGLVGAVPRRIAARSGPRRAAADPRGCSAAMAITFTRCSGRSEPAWRLDLLHAPARRRPITRAAGARSRVSAGERARRQPTRGATRAACSLAASADPLLRDPIRDHAGRRALAGPRARTPRSASGAMICTLASARPRS